MCKGVSTRIMSVLSGMNVYRCFNKDHVSAVRYECVKVFRQGSCQCCQCLKFPFRLASKGSKRSGCLFFQRQKI